MRHEYENLSLSRRSETVSVSGWRFRVVYLGVEWNMNVYSTHIQHSPCLNFIKPLFILPRILQLVWSLVRQTCWKGKARKNSRISCNIYHGTVFMITLLNGILKFNVDSQNFNFSFYRLPLYMWWSNGSPSNPRYQKF